MFMFHAAFALNLLALCAGCALFMFAASRCDCKGACFAKLVAVVVIVLAILSTACTFNSGMKAWNDMRDQCKAGTCDNKPMVQTEQAQPNADKPAAAKAAKPAHGHR